MSVKYPKLSVPFNPGSFLQWEDHPRIHGQWMASQTYGQLHLATYTHTSLTHRKGRDRARSSAAGSSSELFRAAFEKSHWNSRMVTQFQRIWDESFHRNGNVFFQCDSISRLVIASGSSSPKAKHRSRRKVCTVIGFFSPPRALQRSSLFAS